MAQKQHIVKCRCCKQSFDAQPETENSLWMMRSRGWYYHLQCYNDWVKKKNDVHTQADEEMWLDAVWQYLKHNLRIITGEKDSEYLKIKNQWDSQLKKGYTPKGIYFTILYFYEIQKGDPSKSRGGIGIVPYIYGEATQYWIDREQKERGIVARIEQQIKDSQNQEVIRLKVTGQLKKKKTFNLEDI